MPYNLPSCPYISLTSSLIHSVNHFSVFLFINLAKHVPFSGLLHLLFLLSRRFFLWISIKTSRFISLPPSGLSAQIPSFSETSLSIPCKSTTPHSPAFPISSFIFLHGTFHHVTIVLKLILQYNLREDRDFSLQWSTCSGPECVWYLVSVCVFGRVRQEIMVATCDGPSKWLSQELKFHILSLIFLQCFSDYCYLFCFNPYYTLAHPHSKHSVFLSLVHVY